MDAIEPLRMYVLRGLNKHGHRITAHVYGYNVIHAQHRAGFRLGMHVFDRDFDVVDGDDIHAV